MTTARRFVIACFTTLLASLSSGCASMTLVHDVSSTPDGRRVDVVGSVYTKEFFGGTSAIGPRRWVCLRDAAGHLQCRLDTSELPMRE